MIAGLEPYNFNVLKNSNLKIISRLGSGVSNIDFKSVKHKKIKVAQYTRSSRRYVNIAQRYEYSRRCKSKVQGSQT